MECRVLTSVLRLPVPEPPIMCSGASKEKPMPKKTPIITAATAPTEARYPGSEIWGLLRDAGCCASSSSDSVVNIGSGISRPAPFAVTAALGRTPARKLPSVSWCRNENADGSVPCVQLSRDTEARVADTIREASSVPEGNGASPLPLVVGAAETAGRTPPVGSEASVCGFGVIGMSLLAVGVDVITGIDAWVSTTMAGASGRLKQCERLKQMVWNSRLRARKGPDNLVNNARPDMLSVVVMIAKERTHSPAGECQFSHSPASAMIRRLASAIA